MIENSEVIKKNFDDKINNLKEHDKKKNMVLISMLYAVSIIMFIAVSFATIVSYKKYIDVKNSQSEQKEISSNVIADLKKID